MKLIFRLILIMLFATSIANGQVAITNFSGTSTYGSLSVTVTPSATGTTTFTGSCLGTPTQYWIGSSGVGGSYTYNCSIPVYTIHVQTYGLNGGEYLQAIVNGSPYNITAANMISYTGCSSTGTSFISGGVIYGAASSGNYSSPVFDIRSCTRIDTFRLYCTGAVGGVTYHVQVDTLDTASNCFKADYLAPCLNDSLFLFTIGDTTGATYSWTGPGGFTSTLENPFRYPATYADTGKYVVVKTVGGSTFRDSINVTIKYLPFITASSSSPVCVGSTINLNCGPGYGGETYSWSGGNSFTSTLQNPSITGAIKADSGFYTVIIDSAGCKDTAIIHVIVDSIGVATAANSSPACYGATINLTSSNTTTINSYSWSGPGGYSSGLQNPVISSASASDVGTYTVTMYYGACVATATTTISLSPAPPVPTIGVIPPICSGQTLHLTATDTAGATYNWIGPNGFTSTLQNPNITGIITGATGSYTLTCSLGGCSSAPAYVYVLVDSTPATPTVTGTTPLCSGDSLVLTSTCATTGVLYNWTGPASYTATGQNSVIHSVIPSQSGNYTVTVTKGICSNAASVTIVINQVPTQPVVGSTSPMCSGGLLTLTAYATPSTGTYYWTGPNGFTSVVQNPAIGSVTMFANGIYAVYEVVNGCTSPIAYDTVVINPTPAIPVVWSNTPVCEGDTLMLHSFDDTAGVAYNWLGPASAFTSTDQNPIYTPVVPAATGVWTLTVTLGPCSATNITSVAITLAPPLVATNNGPVCTGDTLKLMGASNPGNTFYWVGPYSYIGAGSLATRYPAIGEYAGVYTVTVTEPGGCFSVGTDTVVIHTTPAPPWVPWSTFCQYAYAPPLQAVEATDVLWFPTRYAVPGTGTTVAPIPPTNVPGIYFYYLNQTVAGCVSQVDSVVVVVNPKPVTTLSPTINAICPHDSIRYTAVDADPFIKFHWYPSVYLSDSSSASVLANPITNMDYEVVATNEFNCSDTQTAHVTVYEAGIIMLHVDDSVKLYPGESYHIQPMTNCTSFTWFPSEGLSEPHLSDPVASPPVSTKYFVTGQTENGCIVRDSIYFHLSEETLYGIPNAFTPGTGVNNTFKLLKHGLASLNYFRVFNRWGQLLFETTNIDEGWDGSFKGAQQPLGVYVYEVQAVSALTGKTLNMKGNVTLLR